MQRFSIARKGFITKSAESELVRAAQGRRTGHAPVEEGHPGEDAQENANDARDGDAGGAGRGADAGQEQDALDALAHCRGRQSFTFRPLSS